MIALILWEIYNYEYIMDSSLEVTKEWLVIAIRAILSTCMVLGYLASILLIIAVLMSSGKAGKFNSTPTLNNYKVNTQEMY